MGIRPTRRGSAAWSVRTASSNPGARSAMAALGLFLVCAAGAEGRAAFPVAQDGGPEGLRAELDEFRAALRFVDDFAAPVSVPWRRVTLIADRATPDSAEERLEEAGRWTRHQSGELSANRWRIAADRDAAHSHEATSWDGIKSTSTRCDVRELPADFGVPLSSSVTFGDSELDGALSSWRGSLGLQYLNIDWSDWLDHYGGDSITPLWREPVRGEDCLAILFDQAGLMAREALHPDKLKRPAVVWFDDRDSLLPARLVVLAPDVEMTARELADRLAGSRGGPLPFETIATYEWSGQALAMGAVAVREACAVERGSPIELRGGRLGVGEVFELRGDELQASQRIAYGPPALGLSFPALVDDRRSRERYYVEAGFRRIEISDFDVGMMQALNAWPGARATGEPFTLQRSDYRGATCGPLAVTFAAKLLGVRGADVATVVGSLSRASRERGNSTLLELKTAAASLGLEARAVECEVDDLREHGGIAICHMTLEAEKGSHFAAVHFMEQADTVHVESPPFSSQTMTLEDFMRAWSGRALLLANR